MNERSSLGGFCKLSVQFLENSNVKHLFYAKEHVVRESNSLKPADRTLFIINVPSYCTETNLQELFLPCGPVQKVYFHDKPTSGLPPEACKFSNGELLSGFKVAYVVFKKANSLQKVMKLADSETVLKLSSGQLNCGVTKWAEEYNDSLIGSDVLQKEVDDYMEVYDQRVESEIEKAKELDGVPDEDGWITVTRHGKKQVATRTEANKRKVDEKEKKKRSKKELLNFYTFQIRESKMEHVAQLRKKFEDDKKRIALLKSARKFKPY